MIISFKIEFKFFCFDNAKNKRARAIVTFIVMNKIIEIIEIFVTSRENNNDVIKNQLIVMKKQNRKLQRVQQLQINQFEQQNVHIQIILVDINVLRKKHINE